MCILLCTHDALALSIIDKLVALGWGDEIDKIPEDDALANHKLVKVPQLLTDRSRLRSAISLLLTLNTPQFGRI